MLEAMQGATDKLRRETSTTADPFFVLPRRIRGAGRHLPAARSAARPFPALHQRSVTGRGEEWEICRRETGKKGKTPRRQRGRYVQLQKMVHRVARERSGLGAMPGLW